MKARLLSIAAALLLSVSGAFAAPAQSQSPKQLPYYFPPGVQTTQDPILQRQEYLRYLVATWACFQGNQNGIQQLIPGTDSITVHTDIPSTDSITEPDTKMTIVLDNVVKLPDGRIRVTDLCHQYIITQAQLDYAIKDLETQVQIAAKEDYDFYSKVYDIAVTARAAKLGIPKDEFVKQLNEPMPDHPDVTYREFNYLPKPVKVSDFVPRVLHLGYPVTEQGILGVTWLNTGIVYYDPDGRVVDWLNGSPKVLAHEMVHGNADFQRFPMSEGFDVELMASLPEMLLPDDKIDLIGHSYAATVRELDHIYFGFDFDKMKKDVETTSMTGNIVLNEEKYRYYSKLLDQVQAENLNFFENVTVPEFYSDPIWWSAVNQIRGDNDSVFRITMALHYNPTILGGEKQTMAWLESNKQLIIDTAEKGFEAGLNPNSNDNDMDNGDMSPFLTHEFERLFTPDQRAALVTYFKSHPAQLKALLQMKPAEALKLVNGILSAKSTANEVVR